MNKTDEELMVLYQGDNFEAFQMLYHRHSGRVLGYLRKRWSNPSGGPAVEDLLQTVFLKLHQGRAGYQSRFPFLPWLFSITHHVLVDSHRQRKPHLPLNEINLAQEEKTESPLDSMEVLKTYVSVSEYELLRQRFEEGLSFDELALATGKGPVALRKQISRLIHKLKKVVSQERNHG